MNCKDICKSFNHACQVKECKHWIEFEEDLNCDRIAIEKNGAMTFAQIAERLGLSAPRIKQIEDKVLKILKKDLELENINNESTI